MHAVIATQYTVYRRYNFPGYLHLIFINFIILARCELKTIFWPGCSPTLMDRRKQNKNYCQTSILLCGLHMMLRLVSIYEVWIQFHLP